MRLLVDVNDAHGRLAVEIGASIGTARAAHHQVVDPDKVGESVGAVVQRILDSRPAEIVPEGKKMVSVIVSWVALSTVEIAVPANLDGDDALREAVRSAILSGGLPELVINPTLEFVAATNAYAPSEGGVCEETEICLE